MIEDKSVDDIVATAKVKAEDTADVIKDKTEVVRDYAGATLDTVSPTVLSWLKSPWVIMLLALLGLGGLVVWLRAGRSSG